MRMLRVSMRKAKCLVRIVYIEIRCLSPYHVSSTPRLQILRISFDINYHNASAPFIAFIPPQISAKMLQGISAPIGVRRWRCVPTVSERCPEQTSKSIWWWWLTGKLQLAMNIRNPAVLSLRSLLSPLSRRSTERCLLLRCWILTKSKLSDSLGAPWLPADEARLRMGLNLPRLPKYRIVELSNVHQLDAFSKGIRDASGALVNTWNWRTWFIPLFVVGDDTGVTSHIIIVIPATCNSNCHGCPNYCHSQQTAVYRRKPAQQDFHNQPNGYSYTHTRFKARYYSYLLGFYPLHLKLFFKSTERLSCRWSRPRSD